MNQPTALRYVLFQFIKEAPGQLTTEVLIKRCAKDGWTQGVWYLALCARRCPTAKETDALVAGAIEKGDWRNAKLAAEFKDRQLTDEEKKRLVNVLIRQRRFDEAVEVARELPAPCPV